MKQRQIDAARPGASAEILDHLVTDTLATTD